MSDTEKKLIPAVAEVLGDPNDMHSLFNILPASFIRGAQKLEEKHLAMDEYDLRELMSARHRKILGRLRQSLWLHIHTTTGHRKRVNMKVIIRGITTMYWLYSQLEKPHVVAYLLKPPGNYEVFLNEALHVAVDQIRDILEEPHVDPETGRVDARMADVKRRLFVDIADRVKGMPIQRTENLNVNKEIGVNQSFNEVLPNDVTDIKDIDNKIMELEKDMGDVKEEKDVTPKE